MPTSFQQKNKATSTTVSQKHVKRFVTTIGIMSSFLL